MLISPPAVEPDELAELITDSWRLRAPKRVLQRYEDLLPGEPGG